MANHDGARARYSGATTDAVQRLFEEERKRAETAGYDVVATRWDTSQPQPTLLVEYGLRAPLSPAPATQSAPVRKAKATRRRALGVVGVIVAGFIGLSVMQGGSRTQPSAPSAKPAGRTAVASSAAVATPTPTPGRTTARQSTPTPRVLIAEPVPTATPRPTPQPPAAKPSIRADLPVQAWSAELAWRWLQHDEIDCAAGMVGCWTVLVRTEQACERGLSVTIHALDEDGALVRAMTESRRSARRGRDYLLMFEAPSLAARNARIDEMTCDQAPKRTPKPTPKPKRRPAPRPEAGGASRAAPRGNCDPSYPGVCIRPYPPDLDCPQVGFQDFRVRGSDRHGFDGDNDGVGCES